MRHSGSGGGVTGVAGETPVVDNDANASLDSIEVKLDTVNTNLGTIQSNQDDQTSLLTNIDNNTDGLETLVTSTNAKLDTVNTNLGTVNTNLDTIEGYVDGLESLVTSTNTKLDTVNTNLGTIEGYIDGLETLATSGNASLDSIDTKSTRKFATPTNTRPTVTTTSSIILASNADREYGRIDNQSGAVIYIKMGATAVVGEGIRLTNNDFLELTKDKLWTGDVHAIRNAGSGAVEVFEGTV